MNTSAELLNHIIYEFYSGRLNRENILNESRGVVSGLHAVVKDMCGAFYQQVCETMYENKKLSQEYKFSTKEMGYDTFFDKIKVQLTTAPGQRTKFTGGLNPGKTYSKTDEGLVCSPDIFYSVEATDDETMIRLIESAIGHELTHAFNLYQYGVKNNLEVYQILDNYRYDQRYSAIASARDDTFSTGNRRAVGNLLYMLNRMERGAYIAQLKEELEAKADEITDSKSAWEAVLSSESYRNYKSIERNVNVICSGMCDAMVQKELIRLTNSIMRTDFKTYNQLQKWYNAQWYKWKTKYITTAAKIAYDVYAEHNDMLDGDRDVNETIKPFK